jgi:putative membrane protein
MKLVPGIQIDHFRDLLIATVVLGLLNAFLRPIVLLLTLPVTILTLGLFTLVVNGVMFYLAAVLVKGFHIAGFGTAFVAALLFSILSYILNVVFQTRRG